MPRSHDPLVVASAAFLAANVLHGIDHERQGADRLTTEVVVGGTALTLLAVVALVLAWRRSADAPLVGAVTGLLAAAGIAASHIAPRWSALSDSYPDVQPGALAWAVMLLELLTAAVLGLVGLRELRRRRGLEPSPAQPLS